MLEKIKERLKRQKERKTKEKMKKERRKIERLEKAVRKKEKLTNYLVRQQELKEKLEAFKKAKREKRLEKIKRAFEIMKTIKKNNKPQQTMFKNIWQTPQKHITTRPRTRYVKKTAYVPTKGGYKKVTRYIKQKTRIPKEQKETIFGNMRNIWG